MSWPLAAATRKTDRLEPPMFVRTTQLNVVVVFETLAVIAPENTEAPLDPFAKKVRAPVDGEYLYSET